MARGQLFNILIIFIEFNQEIIMLPTFTISHQPVQSMQTPFYIHHQPPIYNNYSGQNSPSKRTPYQLSQTPPTKFIGNYIIDYTKQVGHGNFSHVYPAIDQMQPNVRLAVKIVNVESLKQQKLQNLVKSEVEVLLSLRHENILFCKDVFWDQKYCYMFTEFCQGGSLESKIKKAIQSPKMNGTFPIQQINFMPALQYPNLAQKQMLPYIKDIFKGLLFMEKKNIIHRDIKAANIFIRNNRAVIADFGFARQVFEPFFDLNIGSLPFMPPEAITKNLYSNKTDVWAFGATIYEIFHGQSPYARSHNVKELIENVYRPLSSNNFRKDLSLEMRELIINCLEIDMDKRKKFSELEQTWFYKRLFQTQINFYNQTNNNNNIINIHNPSVVSTINLNGKSISVSQKSARRRGEMYEFIGDVDTINNSINYNSQSKITIGSKPFGSQLKQKLNVAGSVKQFVYSENKEREKERRQINQNNCINLMNVSEFKAQPANKSMQIHSTELFRNSAQKMQQNNQQNINHMVVDSTQGNRASTQSEMGLQKTSPRYTQKVAFKEILLKIQEIRNLYKLAMILKERNNRLTQIKNRLLLKSIKQMNKIDKLLEQDRIDLTIYDRNKEKLQRGKFQDTQASIVISNRKFKLTGIIKDYKKEFESQIKRRQINSNNINLGYKQIPEFLATKDTSKSSSSVSANKNKGTGQSQKTFDFNGRIPSLSEDLDFIMQTQTLYHAQDTILMSYEECQNYRKSVKQILDQIVSSGCRIETPTKKADFSIENAKVQDHNARSILYLGQKNADDLSRLRWKQKSSEQ